jgi:hypothetical protein
METMRRQGDEIFRTQLYDDDVNMEKTVAGQPKCKVGFNLMLPLVNVESTK